MASDAPRAAWRDPRMLAALVWIFGCAAYYYVWFTWTFLGRYSSAIGDLFAQLADAFSLNR